MAVEEGERAVGKWETRRVRVLGRLEEEGKKRIGREEGWRAREVGEEGEVVMEVLQREKEEV